MGNTKTQKIALDCIYALALFVLLWSYFALVTLTTIQFKNQRRPSYLENAGRAGLCKIIDYLIKFQSQMFGVWILHL
jgi:hypothetical protein